MLRRSDGLIQLQEGRAGQDWILARQFCAYTLLDASAIPPARRKGFAAISIQRWSPFADTRSHVEWVGSRAMVWAWSPSRIQDMGGGEFALAPRRVSPESLHRGDPRSDAAALLAMDEGVEGRIWRDQAMIACQWWPTSPSLEEWNVLRRGAGLPAATAVPFVEPAPLAMLPWTRQRVEAFNDLAVRHRRTLQALAVGLAVAIVAAPLASSLRLLVKTALLEQTIKEQSATVGGTLLARESSERDLGAVEQLLQLRPPQRQLRLLSTVASATPGSWKLLEWRMPDTHTLEVVMQMANPNPTALVRGWEGTGLFDNVAVDIGRAGEVTVKAGIIGAPGASSQADAP